MLYLPPLDLSIFPVESPPLFPSAFSPRVEAAENENCPDKIENEENCSSIKMPAIKALASPLAKTSKLSKQTRTFKQTKIKGGEVDRKLQRKISHARLERNRRLKKKLEFENLKKENILLKKLVGDVDEVPLVLLTPSPDSTGEKTSKVFHQQKRTSEQAKIGDSEDAQNLKRIMLQRENEQKRLIDDLLKDLEILKEENSILKQLADEQEPLIEENLQFKDKNQVLKKENASLIVEINSLKAQLNYLRNNNLSRKKENNLQT